MNPFDGIFSTLQKIVSKHADYSFVVKKMGVTEVFFFFSYNHLKVKFIW